MRKKILILGVTGQDGSFAAEYFAKKGDYVHGLVRKSATGNLKNINHSIVYKYAERSDSSNYAVLDSKIMYKNGLYIYVNNIFDEVYSETNLVPMPGTSFLVGFNFGID